MTRKIRLAMSLALIASTLLWTMFLVRPPIQVYADTFTVDSTSDAPDANKGDGECKTAANTCTLRAAIEEADSFAGDHTITVPAGTYTLTSGHIEISKGMTIAGAGAASTIIDANNASRMFIINEASTKVTISDMTLTKGKANTGDASGGAILTTSSSLDIINAAITNSNGAYGGALLNEKGNVTLDNVTLSDNAATDEGGALHNYGTDAQMTLKNTTVQNNTASTYGGALLNQDGNVTLDTVILKNNTATAEGGALHNYGAGAQMTLKNTTVQNNTAGANGGALRNSDGNVTLDTVILSDNTATAEGGALHTYGAGAQMTLKNTTVQNNTAGANGGGIYTGTGTQSTIQNSAIIGNKVLNRDGSGGGVFIFGTTTIQDSRIISNQANETDCTACYGGGITVDQGGTLTLSQSVMEYNTAYHHGGGIYNVGTTTITDSKIGYNETTYISGGGIYNDSKIGPNNYGLTIRTTDIYSNTANVKPDDTNYTYGGATYSIIGSTSNGDYRANGGGFANGLTGSALVENSTFRFNKAYSEGGAVMNRGVANFTNVSFTDNKVLGYYVLFQWYKQKPKWNAEGGAILSESPSTSNIVSNCEFLRNTSTNGGGAIANKYSLEVSDSLFADNKVMEPTGESPNADVSASGGAIDNYYGSPTSKLVLRRSVIRDNQADKVGGGISSMSAGIQIYDTAIISNTAKDAGGGILFNLRYGNDPCTKAELYNVTISGNKVTDGSGGAIYNQKGYVSGNPSEPSNPDGNCSTKPRYLRLTNTTIVNNTASGDIGGIQNEHIDTFDNRDNNWVKNSIIAHNTSGTGTPSNCGGGEAIHSQDYNISDDSCSWLSKTNDKISTNPVLGKLADNGGSTYTHALLPGSPAYDYIPSASTVQATDQRGKSRTGDKSDVGAFEAQPPTARDNAVSVQQGNDKNNIPVLDNDTSDPTGYLKVDTVTIVSDPQSKATANADGTISYASSSLDEGNYIFTYSVKDQRTPALVSNTATVTVAVTANLPPTVSDVTKTANEDTTVSFTKDNFQSNYSDPTNDTMEKVKIVSLPANGTLKLGTAAVVAGQEILPANLATLTFTPDANWNGTTEFKWNAADTYNYATNDAKVTITITAFNDVPTLDDIGKTIDEDMPLTMAKADFTAKFSDPDGSLTEVRITALPEHGTLTKGSATVALSDTIKVDDLGTLTFTPQAQWHGVTSFGWNGSDGSAYAASSKLVIVTVNSVEDKPVLTTFSKTGLENDTILFADTDFTNNFSDADEDDSLAKIQITSLPANGTLKVGTTDVSLNQEIDAADIGKLSFVPTADWFGTTSFKWNASDGKGYAEKAVEANITITEIVQATTPTVYDFTKRTDEDIRLAFAGSDFTSKFSDSSGGLAKIKVTTSSISGTLALKSGEVYVPVANNQEINAADLGNLTYMPDANWNGTTQFTWTGTSGTTYQATPATVTVIVNAVSDPPVTKGDFNVTKVNKSLEVSTRDGVLSNDSDPEGGILVVATHDITSTLGAAVRVRSTGSYDYNPTVSITLSHKLATQPSIIDTFTYVAKDTDGLTSTETVSITVYTQDTTDRDIQATATAVAQQTATTAAQQQTATVVAATAVVQTATSIAQQTAASIAQQTATSIAQQTATSQTATSVAQSTATSVAQSTATSVAQSTATSVAQSTATSVAQSTATSAAQSTATSAVQSTATSVAASPTVTVTTTPAVTTSPTVTVTTTPAVTTSPTVTVTTTPAASPTITPTVTPGGQPTLNVNFSTGKPGSTFIFTATNFPAGLKGIITINGTKLGDVTMGSDGTVQFIIVTTGSPVGSYTVKVTVDTGAGLAELYEADTTIQLVEAAEMREATDTNAPRFRTDGTSQNEIQVYLPMVQRPQ